jgi:hypothetical protein
MRQYYCRRNFYFEILKYLHFCSPTVRIRKSVFLSVVCVSVCLHGCAVSVWRIWTFQFKKEWRALQLDPTTQKTIFLETVPAVLFEIQSFMGAVYTNKAVYVVSLGKLGFRPKFEMSVFSKAALPVRRISLFFGIQQQQLSTDNNLLRFQTKVVKVNLVVYEKFGHGSCRGRNRERLCWRGPTVIYWTGLLHRRRDDDVFWAEWG